MSLWMAGQFLAIMNTTMFNISVPNMIADIDVSVETGSWIVAGYSIGFALSTLIYSRLSEVVPIRRLVTAGLAALGAGSVFGFFAWDFYSLLSARMLQSAGAGTLTGLGMVVIRRYIPADRRGRAIAFLSAGSTLAFALGPIAGGAISTFYGWNGLFLVTSLVLLLLPPLFRLLPQEQAKPFQFDLLGALLTLLNMTLLLAVLTQRSISLLFACAASFLAHAIHVRKVRHPLIPVALFRLPGYGKLVAVGFLLLVSNLANLFLMPIVLADLFHKTSMEIGLIIAPGAMLAAFSSRYIGRWIDRRGNMMFLLAGHLAAAAVLGVFTLHLSVSAAVILIGYVIYAPANTTMLASLHHETLRMLPGDAAGSGIGFMQLIQYAGGSIAVAFSGFMISVQNQLPAVFAYQQIYAVMEAVTLASLGFVVWYRLRMKRNERKGTCEF